MINIKTDSRKVKKGDIFVALTDLNTDGHDYIECAISAGASEIIVSKDVDYKNVKITKVEDTREYLNNYLKDNYNKYLEEMTIIGVTGTNGKTTSCYLIQDALNKLGYKCAYIGTIGFYMGKKVCDLPNTTPDACDLYEYILEAYENGYKYVALEASSHGLFLKRIYTIPFDYAAFTNLTHAHLELHETKENYALAKQLLFKMLKKNGKAIVNYDDPYKDYYLLKENNNITYGFNGGDYNITKYKVENFETVFNYKYQDKEYKIKTSLIGKYNIYNSMIPLIILKEMGINEEDIFKVMEKVVPPDGRMNMIKYKNNRIIIDYAHTPDGLEKAVDAVNEACSGNLYTIFCCRGRRDRTMRPLMASYAIKNSKFAIMSSDHVYDEDKNQIINDALENIKTTNYKVIWNRKDAIRYGIDLLEENDILLILGKGYEKYNIVNGKKEAIDDIKEINEYIQELEINCNN